MRKKFAAIVFSLSFLTISTYSFYSQTFTNKFENKQRGVSWVAGNRPVTQKDFEPLVHNHVNWIVQTPFGWQRAYNSPTFRIVTDGGILWGETDAGLETTTRHAKSSGIKTLLKPHLWLRNRSEGKWRADIEMETEHDWQSWFDNYRTFILHYAELAEKNGIEALTVGTELWKTAVKREQDWRNIIAEIRKVYHGKLTYSANWYLEFEEIAFWDALDFIGIQGYFPLSEKEHPTVAELKSGWQPHVEAIERVSKHYGKPVIFTEIGYRSSANAAITPWEWPGRRREQASAADLQTQANCYEAFFQTFWERDWCAGAYFWKWFPGFNRMPGYNGRDFTPQHKPAEAIMAKWYKRSLKTFP